MRQRISIALSGVGVAAVLALLLLFGGVAAEPVSAMERMAENIRKAKSFSAKMIVESKRTSQSGKSPAEHTQTGKVYWLAQKASRVDFFSHAKGEPAKPSITNIELLSESKAITIIHYTKTVHRTAVTNSVPGVEMVAKLGEFSGQADRDLGIKAINGKKSRGFEISMKKLVRIPPGVSGKSMAEIWLDSESSLPVLVQFKIKEGQNENTIRIQDFQWNIDLDPKLFDTTLPKGYTEATSPYILPPKSGATKSGEREKGQ